MYADHKLYKNKKVRGKLSDYTLTLKEMTNWQLKCEDKIKELLKSPSTADFPSITEWTFLKEKNKLYVQSYVDSQNSFGATLRSNFTFKINLKTETVSSLVVDGKEYIKK